MTLKKTKKSVFEGVDIWVAILFVGAGQHPKNTKNVVLNAFDGWDVPSRLRASENPWISLKGVLRGSENPWMSLKGVLRAA